MVSRYRPGSKIQVWYDTEKPSVSVVEIETKRTFLKVFRILAFTVFDVLCILSDRWAIRVRPAREQSLNSKNYLSGN